MTGLDRPGSEPDATFGHNNLGRLISASQTGHTLTFGYDALGRQTSEAGPQVTVERTFDAGGRQTSLRTLRNSSQNYYVSYQHLVTGELTAIVDGASQTLASFGYDSLGRRTSLAQAHGGTTSYGYDAVSRLTSHSIDNPGTGADNAFALSYNPAGQVVGRTTSHQAVPYNEHANLNRSDAVNGLNQISQSGSATVTHDARGNMTSDGTRTFGYRSDNAMTSASAGVTLSYDPLGRLSEISSPSGTRQLVHDGASLIQEYGGGSVAAMYVHGARIDEPLVEYDIASGQRRHLMSDDRGSIIAPADDTGLVLGVNRYDEYGVPSSSNTGRFQYNGQPWLPEIGMYYSRARMYDPQRGRFPQPDPIGYGDGANLYNALGGDPVNRVDPSGMCSFWGNVKTTDWRNGKVSRVVLDRWKVGCDGSPPGFGEGSKGRAPGEGGEGGDQNASEEESKTPNRQCGDIRRAQTGGVHVATGRWWDRFEALDGGRFEAFVVRYLQGIVSGLIPADRTGQSARELGLPGGGDVFYNRYSVPAGNIDRTIVNGPRVAWVPGTPTLYFAPYHGRVTPDVPTGYIAIQASRCR